MHRSEARELDTCLDCGAEISLHGDRVYVLGDETEGAICESCAVKRGGAYLESRDAWQPEPEVKDLREKYHEV